MQRLETVLYEHTPQQPSLVKQGTRLLCEWYD